MWNYNIQLSVRHVRMGFGSSRYFYEIIHLFMYVTDLGFCEPNSYNDVFIYESTNGIWKCNNSQISEGQCKPAARCPTFNLVPGGADKSLARPNSRCRRAYTN